MPRNDGTEAAELFESNIFEIASLQGQLRRSQIQSNDAYRQTGDAFELLKECRSLLEIIMDHQLQKDILDLICKIDEFMPLAKGHCPDCEGTGKYLAENKTYHYTCASCNGKGE